MRIKVVLADDEPVILRGLKKLISWEELGLEIVGEANDGNELRQLIRDRRPELIISDISMPGCSGIDMIRELHEQGSHVKVVFISAYQEFDFARQAVQYGAVDYLVKPVNKKHLEDVVHKAASLVREESEGARAKEMLDHYERKHRTLAIEELLDGLMDGDRRSSAELIRMGAVALSRYTSVCLLETDEVMGGNSRWEERERKLVQFALNNIIKETIEQDGGSLMFQKDGRFGILVQHERADEPVMLAGDLHEKINRFLKLKISIGIGTAAADVEAADVSYRSALQALKTKYFAGLNRVIAAGEAEPVPDRDSRSLSRLQSELAKALTSQSKERLMPLAEELLDLIRHQAGGSKHSAITSVYNTILLLEREMSDIGIAPGGNRGAGPLLEKLTAFKSYDGVKAEFSSIVQHIDEQITSRLANKELAQLHRIKTYMKEHYAENITLESMAALIYMNPYYFSSFFKKHTGQNFKQYLTELRMKQALRLLLETDLMIYEIAERVGYNNARHFSDMFKKMYGRLPQEYRQSAST